MTRSATLKQSANKMYMDVLQDSNRSIGQVNDPVDNEFKNQQPRNKRAMTVAQHITPGDRSAVASKGDGKKRLDDDTDEDEAQA
jgi:hypothetical protein